MALYPAIDPELAASVGEVRQALARLSGELPPALFADYIDHIQTLHSTSRSLFSPSRWHLNNAFLFSGFLQGIIIYNRNPVFTFGAPILPWDLGTRLRLPQNLRRHLTILRHEESFPHGTMQIFTIAVSEISQRQKALLDGSILPLLRHFYSSMPGIQDQRQLNLMPPLIELYESQVGKSESLPLTLTHLTLQNMHVYFEMAGERRSHRFPEKIREIIDHSFADNDHTIYSISALEYLIFSARQGEEEVHRIFDSLYFHIDSLVIDYQFTTATIDQPGYPIHKAWKRLKV